MINSSNRLHMLRKKQENSSNGGGMSHNMISSGTTVKGNITASEDFRIDGVVQGNIECKGKVVVGPRGEIHGHIYCANAELFGKVQGNIKTSETLLLKSGSSYQGELQVKLLEIETGAIFNGICKMDGEMSPIKLLPEAIDVS